MTFLEIGYSFVSAITISANDRPAYTLASSVMFDRNNSRAVNVQIIRDTGKVGVSLLDSAETQVTNYSIRGCIIWSVE